MATRALIFAFAAAAVFLGCASNTATETSTASDTDAPAGAMAFADTPGCSAAVEHLLAPVPVGDGHMEAADEALITLLRDDLPEVADALVVVRDEVEFWPSLREPPRDVEVQAVNALNEVSMASCGVPFGTLTIALHPLVGCHLSEQGTPAGMPWPNPGCEGGPPVEMPSVLPCFDPRDEDDPTYSPFYLGHPDDKTSFRAVDCASEQDVVLNRGRWEIWTGPDEQSEQEMWKESEETDGEEPVLPPASTSPPFPPAQTTTP